MSGVWMAGSVVVAGFWLSSCTPVGNVGDGAPGAVASADAGPSSRERKPAEERPGLATGFGKRLKDEWQRESFLRASGGPAGTGRLYYNDKEGVEAMTSYRYPTDSVQKVAGGMVEWGIKSGMGFFPVYDSPGGLHVQGRAGAPYSIHVKNLCKSRVEVVLSVDGLDVIDGKTGSTRKRGYVIAPGKTLEVRGWRTGWDSVARFEFSSVGASYAHQRHGDARNVGVIGIAVFGEKGVDPWKWMANEVRERQTASPFAAAP